MANLLILFWVFFCVFVIVFCSLTEEKRPKDNVKQHITEEMLDEVVNIFLSETDTISLLDIPSTCVSHEADNAEALKWGDGSADSFC